MEYLLFFISGARASLRVTRLILEPKFYRPFEVHGYRPHMRPQYRTLKEREKFGLGEKLIPFKHNLTPFVDNLEPLDGCPYIIPFSQRMFTLYDTKKFVH